MTQEPHNIVESFHAKITHLGALLLISVGTILLVFGYNVLQEKLRLPLLVPVDEQWFSQLSTLPQIFLQPKKVPSLQKKIVYGFLPYWTAKDVVIHPELTHLGYFGLPIDKNGNFIDSSDDGAMGWRTYHATSIENVRQQTQHSNQKFEVLITMMDADDITSFLLNNAAQETFIKNMKQFLKSQPVDGMNIDIEYAGTYDSSLRDAYTTLIKNLSTQLKRFDPSLHISIDVFADSALKQRIWDIPALAPHVDHIVIMTYDFFRSSSPQSGPVAPIFGSEKNRWDVDIVKTLKPFFDQVPSEKLVLGIPFYGYEWQTISDKPGANTYPKTGGLATYTRVQKLLQEKKAKNLTERWDQDALSPYITYEEDGKIQTIYYENSRSLSYKLDLVNETNMGGIAIWALGYEGQSRELWDIIHSKIPQDKK